MPVRVLSFHRTYACRDAGVCCASAWPIPIEQDRLTAVRDALARGALRPAAGSPAGAAVFPGDAPAETPAVLAVARDHCVFFDAGEPHHCRIQHAMGHSALPLACRQFPRVTVHSPLGTSVTLSHYCPTAAELLRTGEPVSIVTSAPAFPDAGEYVGLDVRESLPPLLCPDVLMDWRAWHDWEQHTVQLLCDATTTAEEGLGRLRTAVEHIRRWRPGAMPLDRAIEDAFDAATRGVPGYRPEGPKRIAEVLTAVPAGVRASIPQPGEPAVPREPPEVERRFVAAHAFASWTAYLGHGVRSWFRGVEAAYALLEAGYGFAGADLLLRHLADTHALTRAWNRAEL